MGKLEKIVRLRAFEDLMAIIKFLQHIELFPGRDIQPQRRKLHNHGSSPLIRARRGSYGRFDQPLQHDVRPVFYGRQPGRIRSRAFDGRR